MKHVSYRPEVDGLRAIAVLLVVLVHLFPNKLPGGFVGVDIFFVISGYLITGNIIRDLSGGSWSFLEFYRRRIARIIPSYFLVVLASLCFGFIILGVSGINSLLLEVSASAIYVVNHLFSSQSGYFDGASSHKPLLHLWSLAIEEQFYIFWPALLWFFWDKKYSRVFFILLVIASLLCSVIFTAHDPVASFYLLPSRVWEFGVGGGIAYFEKEGRRLSWPFLPSGLLVWLSFLGLASFCLLWSGENKYPGLWSFVPVFFAFCCMAFHKTFFSEQVLNSAPLVSIGKVSYSLYLWHWPLISFVNIVTEDEPFLFVKCVVLFVSVFLAYLTTYGFEVVLKKKILSFRRVKRVLLLCLFLQTVLAVVAFCFVGNIKTSFSISEWVGVVSKGQFERNYGVKFWDLTNQSNDSECPASRFAKGFGVDYCRLTSGEPVSALIGDSHANHLVYGFSSSGDERLNRLVQVSFGGCAYVGDFVLYGKNNYRVAGDCLKANDRFLNVVLSDKNIKNVIFSYSYGNISGSELYGFGTGGLNVGGGPVSFDSINDSLERLVDKLIGSGKEVFFIIDVPRYGSNLMRCMERFGFEKFIAPEPVCSVPLVDVYRDQRRAREIAENLKKRSKMVHVIDLPELMCDGGVCSPIKDGVLLYRDSNHLSVDGSKYVAVRVEEYLRNHPAPGD